MQRSLPSRVLCLVGSLALTLSAWSQNGTPGEVSTLDGKKSVGLIEVTDDYTIRVTSDTGLQRIPLAMLSESDFRKLGFEKDRSQDGRFWSERQNALEAEKDSEAKPGEKKDSAALELRLSEIAAFQPIIDAYEKSIASQAPADSAAPKPDSKTGTTANAPMRSLFTQPSMGKSPFSGGLNAATQPVSSLGSSAASVVSPAIPAPTVP